jgi:chromosome segregation ATPase
LTDSPVVPNGVRQRLEPFFKKAHNHPPEDNAMSDNPTQEIPDSRSFEERIFARFDALDGRIDRLETKVDGLGSRLSSLENKVDALDGRLTTLEEKVDSRLRESRPIWEAVQSRLEGVDNRLEGLEEEVKTVGHTIMLVHEDNLHMRANQRKLMERVEKLESQSTR